MSYLFDAATLKNFKIRIMLLSENYQLKLTYYTPKHRTTEPFVSFIIL
jgi:hypothetical protein